MRGVVGSEGAEEARGQDEGPVTCSTLYCEVGQGGGERGDFLHHVLEGSSGYC